jgi:hypothetical protein
VNYFVGPLKDSGGLHGFRRPKQPPAPRGGAVLPFGGKRMDGLNKKGVADRTKVNTNEPWEVDYWTNELGVSKDELQRVVKKVGDSAAAVRKELDR